MVKRAELSRSGEGTTVSPVVITAPLLTLDERAAIERAPKLSGRVGRSLRRLGDVAGKVWNGPNTLLGLTYGALGAGVGGLAYLTGLQKVPPGVRWRDNAVQFTQNPAGGVGAITLGNATVYRGDPYDPKDQFWYEEGGNPKTIENGHSIGDHERQHTYQGEQLGPLYLPSNLFGGLNALLHGQDWHGNANWNERGPKLNPPQPWAPSKP